MAKRMWDAAQREKIATCCPLQAQAVSAMTENGAQPEASAGSPAAAMDPAVDDWVLQEDAAETPAAAGSNGSTAGPSSWQQKYNAALRLLQSATADSEVQLLPCCCTLRLLP